MKRIKPTLDGVDAARADAFARWRILALRAASRQRAYRPRLSLVLNDDINNARHLPEDAASWQPPARSPQTVDPGLAVEIVARLLQRLDGAPLTVVWARRGPNDEAESDVCWCSALQKGAPIAGVPVPSLLVLTRWGWRCLPSGTSRTWQRLRAVAS